MIDGAHRAACVSRYNHITRVYRCHDLCMRRARHHRRNRPCVRVQACGRARPTALGTNACAFTFIPAGGRAIPANPIIDAHAVCTHMGAPAHGAPAVPPTAGTALCTCTGVPKHGAPAATPAACAPITCVLSPSPALAGAATGGNATPPCTALCALVLSAVAITARARTRAPHASAVACSAALLSSAVAAGAAPPPPAPCGCGRSGGSPRSSGGPSSRPAPSPHASFSQRSPTSQRHRTKRATSTVSPGD